MGWCTRVEWSLQWQRWVVLDGRNQRIVQYAVLALGWQPQVQALVARWRWYLLYVGRGCPRALHSVGRVSRLPIKLLRSWVWSEMEHPERVYGAKTESASVGYQAIHLHARNERKHTSCHSDGCHEPRGSEDASRQGSSLRIAPRQNWHSSL